MDEKTKRILEIYSKMPLEEVLKLESTLPEDQKIITKKIPVPELVFNEKLFHAKQSQETVENGN